MLQVNEFPLIFSCFRHVCVCVCFKPHKPSSPAVCHSNNLLCCLSPDCCYCHANQGATRDKKGGTKQDGSFFSLSGSPRGALCPSLHPSHTPRHHLISPSSPPSLILSIRPFMCFVIAATISSFGKPSITAPRSCLPTLPPQNQAADTKEQIKLAELAHLLFGETSDYSKNAKRSCSAVSCQGIFNDSCFQYACRSGDRAEQ